MEHISQYLPEQPFIHLQLPFVQMPPFLQGFGLQESGISEIQNVKEKFYKIDLKKSGANNTCVNHINPPSKMFHTT